MKAFDLRLYLVTDSTGMEKNEFLTRCEQAMQGGVTMVQIREKSRTTKEYIELAQSHHQLTRRYQIPLLVDDRLDVALAVHAEGVHLGQEDMPIAMAREILGADKIIGATAKTVAQAEKAYRDGADYLGSGTIYPTTTKVNTRILPKEILRQICHSVPIPVNAIGGLRADNMDILQGIPIAGICVVSALMRAENPKRAAEALRKKVTEVCGQR